MEERPAVKQMDYAAVLRRRKWSILVPFACVSGVVILVALLLPPTYRSSSTILIEQQDIPADFVKATVSTYAEQQIQIINQRIMSTARLLEVINRFGLYQDLRERKSAEEIVGRMRNDIELRPVSVDVVDPKTGRPATATIAFTLSFEGERGPEKVCRVANVLASLFLEENAVTRERQAGEVSRFLESELAKVKADLKQIDANVAAFKETHVDTLPELVQVNMLSVLVTELGIDMLSGRMAQLGVREGYLKAQLAGTPAEFREKEAARGRLGELEVRLINLRQHYSEEHPDIVKCRSEIAQIEKSLVQAPRGARGSGRRPDNPAYIALDSELAGVCTEIRSSEAQLSDLRERLSGYRRNVWASPQVETEYKGLMMARDNTRAKYDDLMRKVMEARVSQGLEREQKGERFTIIDPARMPEKPCRPNRMAIVLIGLVLATGTGVGCGALREFADKSVRSETDLFLETSFPVLAKVPEIPQSEGPMKRGKTVAVQAYGESSGRLGGLVSPVYRESRSADVDPETMVRTRCAAYPPDAPWQEAFQVLRTRIGTLTGERPNHTLMITSPLPGEGKTMVAINLARAYARGFDQPVLLVDCDFRRQDVHKYLGIESGKGLVAHLIDGVPLHELIIWPKITRMTFISGGNPIGESAELLGSARMRALVNELGNRYPDRLVIFDVPPLLAGADTIAFANNVEGIVMVVRHGRTAMDSVKAALDLLPRDRLLGFVINRDTESRHACRGMR